MLVGITSDIKDESGSINVSKCNNLDAIVTADYNTDMMGFSDTSTKVPIINASGLTQEEVKDMIERKITKY